MTDTITFACIRCGVKIDVAPPSYESDDTQSRQRRKDWEAATYRSIRCEECTTRLALAHQIAGQVKGYRPLDYTNNVPHLMDAALSVFAALGQKMPDPASLTVKDAPALYSLAEAGPNWDWMRFTDGSHNKKDTSLAYPKAWAWVDDEHRAALRGALGRFQALRLAVGAPPTPVPPPAGRGCLWCGIGTVEVSALKVARDGESNAADSVWEYVTISHSSLGGQSKSPQPSVPGYLCPTCKDAAQFVGGTFRGAMERAALVAAGARWDSDITIDGLVAWGISGATEPNDFPWAHTNLSALT